MTTYDDDLFAARFAALAPEPLPGDWADVLRRSGVAQQKPWRLGRLGAFRGRRRRRLLVLAAAVLIVVVGTASAIGGVRDFILNKGFIGLPPVGATPSAPESGELVLHWGGKIAQTPYVGVWVYADGRMIWWRDGPPHPSGRFAGSTSGYLEQRLTPEGVELLRSEVGRLLDRSRTFLKSIPADEDPWSRPCCGTDGPILFVVPHDYSWLEELTPDLRRRFLERLAEVGGSVEVRDGGLFLFVPHDYSWLEELDLLGRFLDRLAEAAGSVEVRDGDRFVRLRWLGAVEGPPATRPTTVATPEQLSALRRIQALLTDPTLVLPSSAWADREVRAYVPSHYAVCLRTAPPKDASELLSMLPAQAADLLRDKSRTRLDGTWADGSNGQQGQTVTYCSKLATEEAREVADAVSGLERPIWSRPYTLQYIVAEGAHDWGRTWISFDPYLPDGRFQLAGGGR